MELKIISDGCYKVTGFCKFCSTTEVMVIENIIDVARQCYTIFYSVDEGSVVKGLDYDNAVGFALQGGLDYMLNDKYFLNFDIKKLFLKTDVNVDATNLASGLKIPAEVNIDPLLIGFGVGMKF